MVQEHEVEGIVQVRSTHGKTDVLLNAPELAFDIVRNVLEPLANKKVKITATVEDDQLTKITLEVLL